MSHESYERPRIYLDNAATSWPKPEAVYTAVDHYQRNLGAPAGRSGYAEAVAVSQGVEGARVQLAQMFGVAEPTHVVFTHNGTDALNLALHGLLRPGDHVITSFLEHNSVLRPLRTLEERAGITVTRIACDGSGRVNPDDVRAALRPATRLVALSHASNVTGAIQPVAEIGRIAHEAGVLMLCDAAQTAGHLPLSMDALNVDLLATPGHKGLLGPLGTGLLALQPAAAHLVDCQRQGGTGTNSEQPKQPDDLPFKYEAGNLNVPGILGLGAALGFLRLRGIETIHEHGQALTARLLAGFTDVPGLRVMGPKTAAERVPLVSIVLEGYDPQEVALGLDAVYRIQVRPGLHCAPAMHQCLGTHETGGTIRFSLGAFTTEAEIDATIAAVGEIAASEMWI